jgi:hypothetical protein
MEEMILGMPMTYFLVLVLLSFVILVILCIFVWYWMKMGPCSRYFGAVFMGSGELGLLLKQSGRAQFIKTKYITKIFNATDTAQSWIQRSWESYMFGGASMKILCDMTGIATEPGIQQAMKEFVIANNDYEVRLRDAYAARELEYKPMLINDYHDLYMVLVEGKNLNGTPCEIPAVIKIHSFFEVPCYSVQRFLPHIGSGDLEGHIVTRIDEDKKDDFNPSPVPQWFWIAVAIEVVILVVFITVSYFTNQKAAK